MAASQRSRSTAAQLDVDDQAAADQLMTMMRRPAAVLQDEAAAEEEASAAAADLQLELRRGPWTVDEDLTLVNYIADHGEGRWNSLARAAGLKRTGKSCRLRWLNYLRPDVKRGNFTADEQLLILDLHSRWGNRWSKIAQHLPGRTDNEIKNYWRTRVQKHAKQLNCDANSARFKDAMRYLWMPRLADASQLGDHHGYNSTTAMGDAHGMPVMTSSSSDSFATSESYDGGLYANVQDNEMVNGGDYWMQGANKGFCSNYESEQLHPHEHSQFQDPDLVGWVQGFSEGISENFWSLEDIWKM
ncbi:transcription factor JAMYB-like [Oryza sativa Japonica Group]|uniref:Uncharacterized protein n=4 Tax=Oryza TaxID=4527 RepID=A0A8J8XJK2_ORYSJ|nr:transcription factor JAMYB-like [Oryza sativa Japonica Group]ABA98967.1 Myb-like DNA-binding domain containing protein, expressed [Oryza sativa Japonica Group]EAZ20885.1 hypothetical protein OsJ_36524 [Oryza sativa Japonica Group]KAF2908358.1 hypothetical protein DAI22_12g178700 [Oryza sativa Japonica Group]